MSNKTDLQKYNARLGVNNVDLNDVLDTVKKLPNKINVIDNLTSTSTTDALSANQGRILNETKLGTTDNAVSATKLQTPISVNITGDVTGKQDSWDGSSNISVSTIRRGCTVGQSNIANQSKPWYEFAFIGFDEIVGYQDYNITFHVYRGYADKSTKLGVLTAHVRYNATKRIEEVSTQLVWEYANSGINPSDFVMVINSGTDEDYCSLWAKCTDDYGGYIFSVIAEGSRIEQKDCWQLINKWSEGSESESDFGSEATIITSILREISNPVKIGNRDTSNTWIPVLSEGYMNYTLRKFASSVSNTDFPNNQDYLPTMSFLSYWNGAHNNNNYSNLKYCFQGEIQAKPVSLYDNSSGYAGTITLSMSAANFSYIDIFYKDNGGKENSSTRVYSPDGKYTVLNLMEPGNTKINLRASAFLISGTSMTYQSAIYCEVTSNTPYITTSPYTLITKVVGYY